MRVRTNCFYIYNPNGWDLFHPCTGNTLSNGQIIKVINLPMAPKANTMGQCYVAHPTTNKFYCMVSTASLESLTDIQRDCFDKLRKSKHVAIGDYFASDNEVEILSEEKQTARLSVK